MQKVLNVKTGSAVRFIRSLLDLVSCGRQQQWDRVTAGATAARRVCLHGRSMFFDSMGIQRLDVARFAGRPSSSLLRAPRDEATSDRGTMQAALNIPDQHKKISSFDTF
jgi:hypothetical protein